MAITRRDPASRSHADAPEEPVPLAIVSSSTVRPGVARLVPPEDRLESTWLACHEATLRRAYDIGPSVNIFFQEPESRGIAGGEVTLTERMFMAGFDFRSQKSFAKGACSSGWPPARSLRMAGGTW
jgi:hypothetical protein